MPPNSRAMPKFRQMHLGVADVEVAVGLRRKAGVDAGILFFRDVCGDDVADKIGGAAGVAAGGFRLPGVLMIVSNDTDGNKGQGQCPTPPVMGSTTFDACIEPLDSRGRECEFAD